MEKKPSSERPSTLPEVMQPIGSGIGIQTWVFDFKTYACDQYTRRWRFCDGFAHLAESFQRGLEIPWCFLMPHRQWNAVVLITLPLQWLLGNKTGPIQEKAHGGSRSLTFWKATFCRDKYQLPPRDTSTIWMETICPQPNGLFHQAMFLLSHARECSPNLLLSVPC